MTLIFLLDESGPNYSVHLCMQLHPLLGDRGEGAVQKALAGGVGFFSAQQWLREGCWSVFYDRFTFKESVPQ